MAYPEKFGGVVPPVSTPFTPDGEVDTESLVKLLRYQLDGGVTGIFALGTTSETSALSDSQRAEVIETTVATVAGKVPVIVGVMEMGTRATIAYAQQAEALGADAAVVVGPYYLPYSNDEIMDHFRLVKKAINIPVVAYNIPQMVQTYLQPEVVIQLAKEGVISAVKDSSGNEPALRKMIAATRDIPNFAVFTGAELTVDYALFAGAHGVVPASETSIPPDTAASTTPPSPTIGIPPAPNRNGSPTSTPSPRKAHPAAPASAHKSSDPTKPHYAKWASSPPTPWPHP